MSDKEKEVLDMIDKIPETIAAMSEEDKKALHEECQKKINEYKKLHEDNKSEGRRIGKRLIKKHINIPIESNGKIYFDKGIKTSDVSDVLSEVLYQCYTKDNEGGIDCGGLLNQWIYEKFWGKVVSDYLPKLEEVWRYLHDNKRTKSNKMSFGDADGDIWVEYVKQKYRRPDGRKIIIHKSHCSCADDRTHIFILDRSKYASMNARLHVRTVWDRERKNKRYHFEDDRDIDIPSLSTYRKRNWTFGYSDGRDKGYSLSLEDNGTPRIEWAETNQSRIQHALWLINYMKDITNDPETYECK